MILQLKENELNKNVAHRNILWVRLELLSTSQI